MMQFDIMAKRGAFDELFPECNLKELQNATKRARDVQRDRKQKEDVEYVTAFFEKYAAALQEAAETGQDSLRITGHFSCPSALTTELRRRGFEVDWSDEDDLPHEFLIVSWKK